MNNSVIITADSPVDLSHEASSRYGVKIMPLHIILDGKSYRDGVDIVSERLFEYYREHRVLPSTAAVSVAEYSDFFDGLTSEGASVVHMSLSSEISSTYQNAFLAAEEKENVYVLDTRSLSSGMALLTLYACDLRDRGLSANEIYEKLKEQVPKVRVSFVLDTLDYMSRGGRCSAVTAFGANILGIRPSIEMNDGRLGVSKKYRGKSSDVMLRYVSDRLGNGEEIDTTRCFLVHTGLSRAQLDELKSAIQRLVPFGEIHEAFASCTISTHCGPGCMGVMYMVK
jgi:DegV family protein with EDD domain